MAQLFHGILAGTLGPAAHRGRPGTRHAAEFRFGAFLSTFPIPAMRVAKRPRFDRLAGIAVLVLALGIGLFALRTRIDNCIEQWVEAGGKQEAEYARFQKLFGSDEFILIAYTGRPVFAPEALQAQLDTLDALEAVPGVNRVVGIPAVFRNLFGGEDPEALAEDFAATPFYKRFLISEDGATAGLLVEVGPADSATGHLELTRAIRHAAESLRDHGFHVHLAGPPLLNAMIDEASSRESARTFPIALVFSVLVLAVLLRSVRATAVAIACGGLTVLVALGFMGLAGRPLTMVTAVLPSLLCMLALANVIHLLRRYQVARAEGLALADAVQRARGEVMRACILASITTAAGFLSLLTAEMEPVRELGVFAAAGILSSLPINLLLGPVLISWLRVPAPRHRGIGIERATIAFAHWVRRRKGYILATAGAMSLVCLSLLPSIRVESDPLTFLQPESVTVRDYGFIAEKLTGFYSLELVIDTGEDWLAQRHWPALEDVQAGLERLPGVARVLSPLDVLKKMNHWENDFDPSQYRLPETGETARRLVEESDEDGQDFLRRLVSEDGKVLRLSALIRVMDSSAFAVIVSEAEGLLQGLPKPMRGYCTGIVRQLVDGQTRLVHSQLRSLALAFLMVFTVIGIGLRSLRLAALSVIPNLLPILAAFALMAAAGTPLDAATVMMAGVALGIAVDDTVHLLTAFRRARNRGDLRQRAARTALTEVGPPMVITTVTACIGLFCLVRSAFVPIAWFGILCGTAMVVALLADLLVTPAILMMGKNSHE